MLKKHYLLGGRKKYIHMYIEEEKINIMKESKSKPKLKIYEK